MPDERVGEDTPAEREGEEKPAEREGEDTPAEREGEEKPELRCICEAAERFCMLWFRKLRLNWLWLGTPVVEMRLFSLLLVVEEPVAALPAPKGRLLS